MAENTDEKYPENKLTERIIGCAFEVYNSVGPGYAERIYQKALAKSFNNKNIKYQIENYCPLYFKESKIGSFRLDFCVENKVAVEIKSRSEIYKRDISQLLNYLKIKNIKIGLLILFGKHKVIIKRVIY